MCRGGCWLAVRKWSTFRRPRRHGSASCLAAVAARMIRSTQRPRPARPRCKEMAVPSSPKTSLTRWPCLTNPANLAQSRVRLVNQLHALLRDLLAGGAPTDLTATTAAALLRQVRPAGDAERVGKQIAIGLVSQIRSVDSLLKANAKQISELPRNF